MVCLRTTGRGWAGGVCPRSVALSSYYGVHNYSLMSLNRELGRNVQAGSPEPVQASSSPALREGRFLPGKSHGIKG